MGVWSGVASEANPLIAPFGNAAPLAAYPIKYGMKKVIVGIGATPAQANLSVETSSMAGTCANIATIAGAAPQVAIPIGILCGIAYNKKTRQNYERETGRRITGELIDDALPE